METTRTIFYDLWTVAGMVKLEVTYGLESDNSRIMSLSFIEIKAITNTDSSFSSKLDEEMEEIAHACIADYEQFKQDKEEKQFLDPGWGVYIRAHRNYRFSAN